MTTRCHSLVFVVTCCHSLSFVVTRCHLLSLAVIRCHVLSFVVPFDVTNCTTRCHSLSLVVPLVFIRCTRCHSLSLSVSLVCLFINDRLLVLSAKMNMLFDFLIFSVSDLSFWKLTITLLNVIDLTIKHILNPFHPRRRGG